jgi:hypothetical protein
MSTIPKGTGKDGMNFSAVHVIRHESSFFPNKKNQIPFWVNCNRCVVRLIIHVTKLNIILFKHLQHADNMLQCSFISSIVFKDPD